VAEREVGQAIAKSGIDRGAVFVTSKLSNACHLPDDARRAFDGTLQALGSDYIDLFLIHWPLPARYDGNYVLRWHIERGGKRRERPHACQRPGQLESSSGGRGAT
jgi:2,5-diketo-D-gluconate reductase A